MSAARFSRCVRYRWRAEARRASPSEARAWLADTAISLAPILRNNVGGELRYRSGDRGTALLDLGRNQRRGIVVPAFPHLRSKEPLTLHGSPQERRHAARGAPARSPRVGGVRRAVECSGIALDGPDPSAPRSGCEPLSLIVPRGPASSGGRNPVTGRLRTRRSPAARKRHRRLRLLRMAARRRSVRQTPRTGGR